MEFIWIMMVMLTIIFLQTTRREARNDDEV
jgi:hypothetical protein